MKLRLSTIFITMLAIMAIYWTTMDKIPRFQVTSKEMIEHEDDLKGHKFETHGRVSYYDDWHISINSLKLEDRTYQVFRIWLDTSDYIYALGEDFSPNEEHYIVQGTFESDNGKDFVVVEKYWEIEEDPKYERTYEKQKEIVDSEIYVIISMFAFGILTVISGMLKSKKKDDESFDEFASGYDSSPSYSQSYLSDLNDPVGVFMEQAEEREQIAINKMDMEFEKLVAETED